jgi:hypothetical protein
VSVARAFGPAAESQRAAQAARPFPGAGSVRQGA